MCKSHTFVRERFSCESVLLIYVVLSAVLLLTVGLVISRVQLPGHLLTDQLMSRLFLKKYHQSIIISHAVCATISRKYIHNYFVNQIIVLVKSSLFI